MNVFEWVIAVVYAVSLWPGFRLMWRVLYDEDDSLVGADPKPFSNFELGNTVILAVLLTIAWPVWVPMMLVVGGVVWCVGRAARLLVKRDA